jgi:malonyl-CoA/methylmalonyl-CoA synthetase
MINAPVAGDPDRVGFVSDGRTWSFTDLDTAAARIAAELFARRPALSGDCIGLFVRPGFHWIAALTGIWRAGGVAVPLALSHPPPELDFTIRDSGATLVLVDDDAVAMMTPIATAAGASVVGVSELLSGHSPVIGRRDRIAEDDADRPATLVYTSGTTGRPKAVVTTHGMLEAQVASLVEAWEWTSADRTLLVLPLHHVHGIVNVVLSARAAGAVCEFLPRFDAAATWTRLESGEITVFSAVPTIYHRLIAMWDEAPDDVRRRWSAGAAKARLMMCGSAALPVLTLERWRAITGHTLLERYGMTELGMALSNPLHGDRRPGSVGQPLPRVHVRIVDEAGAEVGEDVPGDLEVRGPTVFREYWHRPEATRDAFRGDWFRTGDVAVLERGAYRLLGRRNIDIIKTGGHKISALEIEEVLRLHPGVADCAVVGLPDAEWGERVCVAVELRPSAALSLDDVQAWASARLAPVKVPRALRCVAALPRNAMGKVIKKEVGKLFG